MTVTRLFQPMHQVVTGLSPDLQITVSDHADLPHAWYQEALRYNWRNGEKLIPTTWLDNQPTPETTPHTGDQKPLTYRS
ncbi:DUF3732 domain-containing protein [Streptomyces sp. NBC_01142]|uniref:DUF3732 domain-containing protein n=1 Tax=Streptomyces sp. NBC_01142 TaxID=2975865 RepID=UPI0022583C23|nr:DUF3732 domain-containing protein [Streptomyces sp. NBC_01142]MCX4826224.1 DUF3732 domain-containing protein [Streptomyces sp. NBC_01142]